MTEKQVVKYDVTEAAISEMAALYMDLTVEDFEDEKGYAEVELGRKAVKAKRVAVEKQRKVFKADALEYGRMVDSKAKEIVALLEPIEFHLTSEGDKVRNELARIEAERELLEKAKIQSRVDDLLKVGVSLDYFTVATMPDEDFNTFYTTARTNFEAEQAKLAAEEKAKEEAEEAARIAREKEDERLAEVAKQQEEEAARLKKIADEQAAKETELKAVQDKIDADKKATQDAVEQEALLKRVAAEAEERAKKEAEEAARIAREKEDERLAEVAKAQKVESDRLEAVRKEQEKEAERQEALRPDKEKLEKWVDSVLSLVEPELATTEAQELLGSMVDGVGQVLAHFNEKIERL